MKCGTVVRIVVVYVKFGAGVIIVVVLVKCGIVDMSVVV